MTLVLLNIKMINNFRKRRRIQWSRTEAGTNIPKEYDKNLIHKIQDKIKNAFNKTISHNTGNLKLSYHCHKPGVHTYKSEIKVNGSWNWLHNCLKTKILHIYIYIQNYQASPCSESMHLLAHLSHHLLPDNKLFDHHHTHTEMVSYAQHT